MEAITELTKINWIAFCITLFAIAFAIKEIIEIIGYFKKKLRIKTGFDEDKETLEGRISTLEKHDTWQYNELTKISEVVDHIKDEVTLMRKQRDEDKLAEYKDKVGQSYRCYKERKYSEEEPIPYWNHMEKEALEGLIKQYESHGGKNSFVHSIVEVEMQTWKVID